MNASISISSERSNIHDQNAVDETVAMVSFKVQQRAQRETHPTRLVRSADMPAQMEQDARLLERLVAIKRLVLKRHTVAHFSDSNHLAAIVAADVATTIAKTQN
jgi:hypothetical protein